MKGWIKLHRVFLNWEWFDDANIVKLFIYLLLSANHKDKYWKGILVKRGQLITGLSSLNKNTKISVRTLRTCLAKLEKTQEIDRQSDNQKTIITICKYDDYQTTDELSDKQNDKQTTSERQASDNNQELKKDKNDKKIKYAEFVFLSELENKKLIKEHGQSNTDLFITILDNYKGSNGKKYKSDYRAILNWVIDKAKTNPKFIKPKNTILA